MENGFEIKERKIKKYKNRNSPSLPRGLGPAPLSPSFSLGPEPVLLPTRPLPSAHPSACLTRQRSVPPLSPAADIWDPLDRDTLIFYLASWPNRPLSREAAPSNPVSHGIRCLRATSNPYKTFADCLRPLLPPITCLEVVCPISASNRISLRSITRPPPWPWYSIAFWAPKTVCRVSDRGYEGV